MNLSLETTRRYFFFLLQFTLTLCARAEDPVTCALIPDPALDLRNSATFQMLGVELARQPGLALLERDELDTLLKERSLQSALLAEGIEARRSLGTLLKARLLVILRAGEKKVGPKKQRFIDVVISETESGLRLSREQLPWDDAAPQALCAPVAAQVTRARLTLATPVRAILAVPPFLSDDLEHRFDSMREAYPALLMETLGQVPGLRLASLAEAQALADEIRLSGGDKISRALLPYYLHGRYHNEGLDPARTVRLTLELTRSEQTIGRRTLDPHPPEAAAGALRQAALDLLGKGLALRPSAFNADAESAELARKAGQFEQIGDWTEALTLTEAALLLKPIWPEMRRKAVEFSTVLINESGSGEEDVRRALALNHRALDHLAIYLRQTNPSDITPFLDGRLLESSRWMAAGPPAPALAPLVKALQRAECEMILDWVEYLADHPEVVSPLLRVASFLKLPPSDSPAQRRKDLTRLVQAIWKKSRGLDTYNLAELGKEKLADPAEDAAWLSVIANLPGKQYPLLADYLRVEHAGLEPKKKLARLSTILLRASAATLDESPGQSLVSLLQNVCLNLEINIQQAEKAAEQQREIELARAAAPSTPQPATPAQPAAPADADYALEPIKLAPFEWGPNGWCKAGQGIDLVWDQSNLYALRAGGALTLLHCSRSTHAVSPDDQAREGNLDQVVFDGRYAWVVIRERLLTLDPATGAKGWVEPKNGLPPGEMKIAPLAPGRVCAVGGFGRAWCAVVEWDGTGQGKVDVFHEARQVRGEWSDPKVAFKPRFAVTLNGTDQRPRVLVGRDMDGSGGAYPLLLDPGRRIAEVVPERLSVRLRNHLITAHEGRLYWIVSNLDRMLKASGGSYSYSNDSLHQPRAYLASWGTPAYRENLVFNHLPDEQMEFTFFSDFDTPGPVAAFVDGQCFLFINDFWWLDRAHHRLVQLKGPVARGRPRGYRVCESNLYGTVLLSSGAYAFRPRLNLAASLDSLTTAATAGGRQILERDPIEGAPVVLRKYQAHDAIHYTTLTVPLRSSTVTVDRDQVVSGTVLVLLGPDQAHPGLRQVLGNSLEFLIDRNIGLQRSLGKTDPGRFAIYPGAGHANRLLTLTIMDALGNPLAGAEVRPSYRYFQPMQLRSNSDFPDFCLELPARRTDAHGRVDLICPLMSVSAPECRISHPEYGSAICRIGSLSGTMTGAFSGPLQQDPRTDYTLRVPLVRRDASEARLAIRGRLIDGQGRPISGGWIGSAIDFSDDQLPKLPDSERARLLPPFGAGQHNVVSDADGRFRFYPVVIMPDTGTVAKLVAGSMMIVEASVPNQPGMRPIRQILDNQSEHTLQILADEPAAAHTLTFMGESDKPLLPGLFRIQIVRMPRSPRVAPPVTIYDGRLGAPLPRELILQPGRYLAISDELNATQGFEVTARSPRELIVRFQSRKPVAPAASQGTPPVANGARISLGHQGQVLHAVTGKPMAGIYVLSYQGSGQSGVETLTAEQWRALHDYQGPLDATNAAALKPLAQNYQRMRLTRTDAEGRFTLARNAWDAVSVVIAFEEHYLVCEANVWDLGVTSGTMTVLPPLKLYPSGKLKLEARINVPPASARSSVWLSYVSANSAPLTWLPIFAAWGPQSRISYRLETLLQYNTPTVLTVPAGVRFKLRLTPRQRVMPGMMPPEKEFWGPPMIEREVEVTQGATVDLGKFEFHKLTPEEAERQAAALQPTPTPPQNGAKTVPNGI